jgi:hypothetical protein
MVGLIGRVLAAFVDPAPRAVQTIFADPAVALELGLRIALNDARAENVRLTAELAELRVQAGDDCAECGGTGSVPVCAFLGIKTPCGGCEGTGLKGAGR